MTRDHSGDEYDGPRLGELVKFSVAFGPDSGIDVIPTAEGMIYISPQAVYQVRSGEFVALDTEAEPIYRAVATYVDPGEYR